MLARALYLVGVYTLKAIGYLLLGAFVILRGLGRLPAYFRQTRQLVSPALTCPSCQAVNTAYGRFTCGCGATALTHVAAPCAFCHERCRWIACQDCGASIPVGAGR